MTPAGEGGSIPLPRIFCIPATDAPVVAVIEKHRRKWWRIGRWDTALGTYEAGAWFSGSLYPQRCDLSPDGRWFAYLALKPNSEWPAGETYLAISRLPWLKALAAWRESGTWTRGIHFVSDRSIWPIGIPTVGDAAPCRDRYGVELTNPAAFATERRRGWVESDDTPVREPDDTWDQRRDVKMQKPSPTRGEKERLCVAGRFAAERGLPDVWPPHESVYELVRNARRKVDILTGVQWADWDPHGHLLVATWDSKLQKWQVGGGRKLLWEFDLGSPRPDPRPAPDWASEW